MTDLSKFTMVKAMTDESDEVTISAFLDMAGEALYHHVDPYKTREKADVLDEYGGVQVRIAAAWLNKRGADGQVSHSENGISRSWETGDIPPSILSEITTICGVVS